MCHLGLGHMQRRDSWNTGSFWKFSGNWREAAGLPAGGRESRFGGGEPRGTVGLHEANLQERSMRKPVRVPGARWPPGVTAVTWGHGGHPSHPRAWQPLGGTAVFPEGGGGSVATQGHGVTWGHGGHRGRSSHPGSQRPPRSQPSHVTRSEARRTQSRLPFAHLMGWAALRLLQRGVPNPAGTVASILSV